MAPLPTAPNAEMDVLTADTILQMTQDMFHSMLDMECEPLQDKHFHSTDQLMQSAVHITGIWNAVITVIAPESVAKTIACHMFDTDADSVTADDIQDSLGEVANVIGGNAKGIMDQDCNLSLPCVGKVVGDLPEGQVSQDVSVAGGQMRVILKLN